jgi:hypothetical protein
MHQAYVVTGSLRDGSTVALDERLPQDSGKVRVTVELLPAEAKTDLASFLAQLWEQQRQREHAPPSKEEVDAYLQAERASWDD